MGGGPAGLNAALILGRATRRVLLCDRGTPRNWASVAMYGFVTRDGTTPTAFRGIARQELSRYPNVTRVDAEVLHVARDGRRGFLVTVAGGRRVRCRKLLIATGVLDVLPEIPDIETYFGISVFQCPYCDGWEFRDRPLAVYGRGKRGFEMARALTCWSADLVLCSDGPARLTGLQRAELRRKRIPVRETPITRLRGKRGRLQGLEFEDGSTLQRDAMFFDMPSRAQSRLTEALGCLYTRDGGIKCGRYEATSVPGVFVAGNIVRDVQFAVVAAAEGARAAFGINRALTREDFERRAAVRRVSRNRG